MCVLEAGWDASSPHTQQPSAGQHPHGHRVGKMGDHMGKADTPELPFTPPPQQPHGVPVHPLLCHDGCHEQVKVP